MIFPLNISFEEVARVLAEPVSSLLDPTKRVFAPYLASAAVIALVVSTARGLTLRASLAELFSRRVWLHPSSLADLRLIAARAALRVFTAGLRGVSVLAVAALLAGWLRAHAGDSPLRASPFVVAGIYTVLAFIADDLARFAAHWLSHRVPALWAFHRVHHAAEVLTPFTLYRTHPVDAALNQSASALAVGAVTGVLAWSFGPALQTWQLFGVEAIGAIWSLAGANLRHSEVWVSFGPRVERWILSPAQHQVHHSRAARHRDQNFGTALALWDRLLGSLYTTTPQPEALSFGLPIGEAPLPHTVRSMLLSPFASLFNSLRAPAARVALAAASLLSVSCSSDASADRVSLLQSMARCTMSAQDQLITASADLATATQTLASAPGDASRAAARAAWERAMDAWQRLEMHTYGPAAGTNRSGGQGLRPTLYAWPDFSRCLIEQRIVSRGYEGASFAMLPGSAKGLAAIEYLLFEEGADNACPATEDINAMGTWSALGRDELQRRRAAYASAAAADLVSRARALRAAWGPNGFETQLITAGRGSTVFSTQQLAFSAVADGVLHLDSDTKDLRLGRPLGIVNCTTGTCPEAVESPFAARGLANVRNNLAGARLLLLGCAAGDNQGFDDRLEATGSGALAVRLRALLDGADAALNALPGNDLRAALSSNPAGVRRAYDAVKALTDFLKMEFSVALQIASARVEGDND